MTPLGYAALVVWATVAAAIVCAITLVLVAWNETR